MDERAIRAMLAVLNLTTDDEREWAAEPSQVPGITASSQGAVSTLRFWLVEKDSHLWKHEDLLWA